MTEFFVGMLSHDIGSSGKYEYAEVCQRAPERGSRVIAEFRYSPDRVVGAAEIASRMCKALNGMSHEDAQSAVAKLLDDPLASLKTLTGEEI